MPDEPSNARQQVLSSCRYGLRLPPEEDCLLGINMQLTQQRPQGGDAPPPSRCAHTSTS